MFERSDFGHLTSIDRFIYIKIIFMTPLYIKRPSLACPKSEHEHYVPNVRNPNKVIPNNNTFGFQHCPITERSDFGR